ncbi:MAG: universal stress protein [Salinirussus sp.]
MDLDLVLAPVDCSDGAERAVDCALAVARRYDAALHLLHVVDERILAEVTGGEMDAAAVAEDHRLFADDIDDRTPELDVRRSTVAGFSVRQLSRTPGSVVLDAAEEVGADFLVVPREAPSGEPEETLGKAALYVLQYASQPVLSV